MISPSGRSRKVCRFPKFHHILTFQIIGYIDVSSLEVGVRVEVFGAHILNLYGNLKDGVVGKIDLFLAEGEIRLYLDNGNGTVNSK